MPEYGLLGLKLVESESVRKKELTICCDVDRLCTGFND
jgi:hypothetical protein